MARRKAAELPVEKKHFPRWLIAIGAIAATAVAYFGARGGPEYAIQEVAEWAGFVKAPHIVLVEPTLANPRRYLISIENPSFRRVQITGYQAEPIVQLAAALSKTMAEEEKPQPCDFPRDVTLKNPVVIAPKLEDGLEVEPWVDECDFSIRVKGTTGTSNEAFWVPKTIRMLKALLDSDPSTYRLMLANADPNFVNHLIKSGLPDPATIVVKLPSEAPPPPPPLLPSAG
jgi:hypothetical protein